MAVADPEHPRKIAFLVFPDEKPDITPAEQLLDDHFLLQRLESHSSTPTVSIIQWPSWPRGPTELNTFTTLIMKSCWEYHLLAAEFKEWLLDYKAIPGPKARLINDVDVILWNLEKGRYLPEMREAGFKIPKTVILRPEEVLGGRIARLLMGEDMQEEAPWGRSGAVVVKPAISAGSYNTVKFRRGEEWAREKSDMLREMERVGGTVLVQEFVGEIAEGEWSLVFIAGVYTHAVLKVPPRKGVEAEGADEEFRCQSKFGGVFRDDIDPPRVARDTSERIVEWLKGRFGVDQLGYVRVDGVMRKECGSEGGDEGTEMFVLMEVECIEPWLCWNSRGGQEAMAEFVNVILNDQME